MAFIVYVKNVAMLKRSANQFVNFEDNLYQFNLYNFYIKQKNYIKEKNINV